MANITPVDNWSDIPQIEQTDYVLGGEGQIANQQAQALANRIENLKNTVTNNKTTQDNKNDSIDAAINDLNTNKVNKSDIVNNATTTASGKVLDGRMGKTLNDTITSNYNTLNTNKVNKSDVVNNYTTTTAGKVLDARVAVSLKTLIDGKQPSGSYVLTSNIVNNATTTVSGKVLDGRMGKTLNDTIVSNYNTLNTNKINKSDIVTNYTTNNTTKVLSASVGYALKALIDTKINISNISDNLTTNDASKVLSAKQGYNLNTNKVNKSDIVNNLTSTNTDKPLSANQGKVLKDLIDQINIGNTGFSFYKTGSINYNNGNSGIITVTQYVFRNGKYQFIFGTAFNSAGTSNIMTFIQAFNAVPCIVLGSQGGPFEVYYSNASTTGFRISGSKYEGTQNWYTRASWIAIGTWKN